MSINRELSQLASFIDVQESNNFIGISTGGTYTVGIGTSSVIIGSTGIITATQFHGPTGSSLIDKIDLQDEGNPVGTGFNTLNFVGTGVTITEGASGIATVTITGSAIIGTSGEVEVTDNGDGTTTLSLADEVGITSSLTVGTVKIESGIITATSGIVTYHGDGSGLTNINASSLSGIATDSDKLDGQDGTYYLDYANFTNTPPDIRWFGTAVGIWTSSSVGIGTTNATSTLTVDGTLNVSGVSTFQGNVNLGDDDKINLGDDNDLQIFHDGNYSYIKDTGTGGLVINTDALYIKNASDTEALAYSVQDSAVSLYFDNSKKFETTVNGIAVSGIITATSGVVTYYGDGTNLTLTNSVALGGDTTGNYVASISGTANQIAVTGGTGEGSTPVISIPTNPTLPGTTVTIQNDLQVNRDLNVNGNITIGGTSATLFTQTLSVADADLILGVRTDANGNDVSTDTTASHGGIAIASTEGTPLVTLVNPGAGETLPATYKKIMWFEQGAFTGLGTDAWLINYGVGIGSTQVPNNVVLAAGDVHVTNNDIKKVRDINATGIATAATFYAQGGTYAAGNDTATDAAIVIEEEGSIYTRDGVYLRKLIEKKSDIIHIGAQNTSLIDGIHLRPGTTGGSVKLHAGGSTDNVKLQTTTNGINVTGTTDTDQLNVSGVSTFFDDVTFDGATAGRDITFDRSNNALEFEDNAKAIFGSGTDNLSIYHNGANSIISNDGNDSGSIYIRVTKDGERVHIQSDNGSGGLADYFAAYGNTGEARLYHFGNQKLATKSNGIDVTGHTETDTLNVSGLSTFQGDVLFTSDAEFDDNVRVHFGTDNDFDIYHVGTHAYLQNSTGDIMIVNGADGRDVNIITDNGSGGTTNYFRADGSSGEVQLYHFGTKKFATKEYGIDVTGHIETDTLNVSGIATAQDFNSASDENLKTNIRTIEDPLAKVVQIRGVNFDWKESQRPALGVIAQEIEKVLPELVADLPDGGTKTVNYNGLIGLLIETVKEQQKQIDTLSERLSKLE